MRQGLARKPWACSPASVGEHFPRLASRMLEAERALTVIWLPVVLVEVVVA
jgi:hypothetical protein